MVDIQVPWFWYSLISSFLLFFSTWVFFHEHLWFTGQQGKGEGIYLTPLYHFHLLHRHLDISRAITLECSPLHIASSRTRTGDLWFPSASRNTSIGVPTSTFSLHFAAIYLDICWRVIHKKLTTWKTRTYQQLNIIFFIFQMMLLFCHLLLPYLALNTSIQLYNWYLDFWIAEEWCNVGGFMLKCQSIQYSSYTDVFEANVSLKVTRLLTKRCSFVVSLDETINLYISAVKQITPSEMDSDIWYELEYISPCVWHMQYILHNYLLHHRSPLDDPCSYGNFDTRPVPV